MGEFKVQKLGVMMQPEEGNANEFEGVLNPAAVRGKDGNLYLFPRLVAKGNYSRIGVARVVFNEAGDPTGVERLGIALEPEADYELRPDGGGCEDPRISFVEPLDHYVMTYVAFGAKGPRIAVARSNDLLKWERVGLATFTPYKGLEFDGIDNKDSCVFGEAVPCPSGSMELGILHRPLFPGTSPEELQKDGPRDPDEHDHKESIWISYLPIDFENHLPVKNARFTSHFHLAKPEYEWEKLKIGCGAPPVMTQHGWMMVYHGVDMADGTGDEKQRLTYSAGVMVLDKNDPKKIIYRSPEPVMKPELPEETVGLIANVVFPTGIDHRTDINMPNRFDIYYGMADDKIGVARMDIPDELPVA